ncbi:MAG TPA: PIN domain-containing protein [Terriglobales bacterium]|nr:PIN domain-containing protein [Terriglobales bacterium]
MKAYFDTTVLVAACIIGHSHHNQAAAVMQTTRTKKLNACTSVHALAEFYSVLTRAPFTPPVYPSEAWQLLSTNILPSFDLITLTPKEYLEAIQNCALQGWSGGRVYDALHLRCAQKFGCDRIYTFNLRHFKQLSPELADRVISP